MRFAVKWWNSNFVYLNGTPKNYLKLLRKLTIRLRDGTPEYYNNLTITK